MEKIMALQTYAAFQDELISAAKELQGDNYIGDDYYRTDAWTDYFEDGDSAQDAVVSDMSYWV